MAVQKKKKEPIIEATSPQGVVITHIEYDGSIARTEGDEYVEMTNRGPSSVDISGYVLNAGGRKQIFVFPAGTVLEAGASTRVYTNMRVTKGKGFNAKSKTALWNNKGDIGTLFDTSGHFVSSYAYGIKAAVAKAPKPSKVDMDVSADGLSAEEIWSRVRAKWPGFDFMWEPGSSEAEIAAAESQLGVKLPKRVRELMSICSGASFPQPMYGTFSADACLVGVGSFKRCSAEMAELLGWDDETARDHVLVGENFNLVDYGVYIALRVSTGEVVAITLNTGEVDLMGSFENWLLKRRPGNDAQSPWKIYVEFLEETGEEPEAIVEHHRKYMDYASLDIAQRRTRWVTIEPRFLEVVQRLARG